ncbi:MAG TPA: adenylyl-sulfate kinase [Burkholderiales bacterium]|nr:adenylyl-sulfate kinase [Burkholderiales bacterium]
MVIWLVGLSGAGKTTLGEAMVAQWRTRCPATVLLDGDAVRRIFDQDRSDADYDLESRRRNARRITYLCEWLDTQGLNVVCCILSIFPEMRAANRTRFSRYFEVFLDAPLSALVARDRKGLYAAALRGERRNVVGVDLPFERPQSADLVIDTTLPAANPDTLARELLDHARAW